MNKFIVAFSFVLIFMIPVTLYTQETGHKYDRKISLLLYDTLHIDILSIVPESFTISDTLGNSVPSSFYKIDYSKAKMYFINDSVKLYKSYPYFNIKYQTFSFNLSKIFTHKKSIDNEINETVSPYVFYGNEKSDYNIYSKSELERSGSISRGISFGNSQDMSITSGLNLQLSGKISEDVSILAAITDNNIPVQPEGNTSQLQEFDKVFIKVMAGKSSLTAGDFNVNSEGSYFMRYNKKTQGALFSTSTALFNKKGDSSTVNITAAAAVSKGKYARNQIAGVEGNQGPYKLKGANNENFIVVLAGSEKVFLDGVLLSRGNDKDYVIDYNTAEVTFTPTNIITCEKRIIVEFEYSERNYARSLILTNIDYDSKKVKFNFSVFSEQDHKNQNFQIKLSEEQKQLLSQVGDNIESAYIPNIEMVNYSNNEVLYKMIDTVVAGIHYDSVFVYSTNPDNARYRLNFSDLGNGKGNYIRVVSSVNGKVFKWIAPVNGIPQGNWEPVKSLIAPEKKQMIAISTEYMIKPKTKSGIEIALSVYDKNTFSDINNDDNTGIAFKTWVNNSTKLSSNEKNWKLNSTLVYEMESKNFSVIERYKTAEYERNWNLFAENYGMKHQPTLSFEFVKPGTGNIGYNLSALFNSNNYSALKHNVFTNLKNKKNAFSLNTSLLNGKSNKTSFQYITANTSFSKNIKLFTIGINDILENNKLKPVSKDSLLFSSFAFNEYEIFAEKVDTSKYSFKLFYKGRNDFISNGKSFSKSTSSFNSGFKMDLIKNPLNIFRFTGTFRQLEINDKTLIQTQAGQTLDGRIEHLAKLVNKTITLNTFYECSSGMERKKEFSYVEVAAGQGTYQWTDYNNNNIRELNEFEIAIFNDKANFVRIYTPTNDYIKTYFNQFSEVININPRQISGDKNGFVTMLSKFSGNMAYSIEHKTNGGFDVNSLNPFSNNINDSSLVMLASSFKSTLFYNRSGTKFSSDLSYQDTRNKNLLNTGYEARMLNGWTANIRVCLSKEFTFRINLIQMYKKSMSEYFPKQDYKIMNLSGEPSLSWQPSNKYRISIRWMYSNKENRNGEVNEKAFKNQAGSELRYNILSKGSFSAKINYINIKFAYPENTPIAYEMIEGLKPGDNVVWNISFQQNLSEYLQMIFLYDGRSSPGSKIIHTGSVQLRAYF